jgi:hypothetical protein
MLVDAAANALPKGEEPCASNLNMCLWRSC